MTETTRDIVRTRILREIEINDTYRFTTGADGLLTLLVALELEKAGMVRLINPKDDHVWTAALPTTSLHGKPAI